MVGLNEIDGNEVCTGSVSEVHTQYLPFTKLVHILKIYFILKLDFLDHIYHQYPTSVKISNKSKIIDKQTTNFQKKTTILLQGHLSKSNFHQKIINEIT
jgi:hypothetical protein